MAKIRLDQLVLNRGMADSRARAQALILSGRVMRGTERLTKPGMALDETAGIILEGREHPWVSRGGMKLAYGLETFALNPAGKICVDVGASTGGFTDVLLHHGAAKVYGVDVGYGQLDDTLRHNPRVVVMERTNARYLTREQIPDPIDLIVCDASFISLKTVLPAILHLAACNSQLATLLALIKPQFEAGKARLRKGVVRDPAVHAEVCAEIRRWLAAEMGWDVRGLCESPVTGPKGNREFLIFAEKP